MHAKLINVSLKTRLQCLRLPASWRVENIRKKPHFVYDLDRYDLDRTQPSSNFDPWKMRGEFFRLKEGNDEAAIKFLNGVGLFDKSDVLNALLALERGDADLPQMFDSFHHVVADDGAHRVLPPFIPLTVDRFWEVRNQIRGERKKKPGAGFQWDFTTWNFTLRFPSLRRHPAMVVTTFCFVDALAASIRIDDMRNAKWIECKRQDCDAEFAAIGRRKRKFCSWYCGHITSVRESRKP